MCTGDHARTAVAVARSAGLVDERTAVFLGELHRGVVEWRLSSDASVKLDPHTLRPVGEEHAAYERFELATTGDVLQHLFEAQVPASADSLFHRVLLGAQVLARLTPAQKALIVSELQKCGLYVGACGDGGNDSLMLRCAHVGISLSQVEASVAAPFTYAVPDPSIDVIPRVLCEGRGALATSFCLFQFMALYSTIQFANALLIVFAGSFLSNNMRVCAGRRGLRQRAEKCALRRSSSLPRLARPARPRAGISTRTSLWCSFCR